MNRRGFLSALFAAPVVAVLPAPRALATGGFVKPGAYIVGERASGFPPFHINCRCSLETRYLAANDDFARAA